MTLRGVGCGRGDSLLFLHLTLHLVQLLPDLVGHEEHHVLLTLSGKQMEGAPFDEVASGVLHLHRRRTDDGRVEERRELPIATDPGVHLIRRMQQPRLMLTRHHLDPVHARNTVHHRQIGGHWRIPGREHVPTVGVRSQELAGSRPVVDANPPTDRTQVLESISLTGHQRGVHLVLLRAANQLHLIVVRDDDHPGVARNVRRAGLRVSNHGLRSHRLADNDTGLMRCARRDEHRHGHEQCQIEKLFHCVVLLRPKKCLQNTDTCLYQYFVILSSLSMVVKLDTATIQYVHSIFLNSTSLNLYQNLLQQTEGPRSQKQ